MGPLHAYVTGVPVPVTPVALKVIDVPTHNWPGVAVTVVIVGTAFTDTVPVCAVKLVQPVVVYVTARL